jgi:hypothetical protein
VITTRRILATLVAVIGGLVLISLARQAADVTPTSDTAVIESYTLMALRGQLLLGPYSRFQWHHPGPLYFFWMAPFYGLAGFRTVGLNAAALTLNLASFAVIAAVVTRRRAGFLAISICLTIAIFLWRAGEMLTSPWNPHIPVLAMMALIVTAADAVSGTPMMLPGVAMFASLVGQTHVGLLPSALAIGSIALAGAAVARPASRAVSDTAMGSRVRHGRFGSPVLITGVVLIVLWIPPIVEQLTSHPGNITQLWTFFVSDPHRGQTFATAVSAWSDMVSGLVRPDFYVAHGWPLRESRVKWSEALAVVQLIGLLLSGAWAFRAGRRFEAALAALLVLVALLALGSATRIEGSVFDHEVFWISALGVLNMALLVGLIAGLVLNRRFPSLSTASIASTICWLSVVWAAVIGVRHLQEAVVHSANPGVESEAARAVADDLQQYLQHEHIIRPLVRIDQDAWGMAAGVILRLQKAGVPVAVEDDWIAMFTPAFAASGQEPVALTVAGKAEHIRMLDKPGDMVIVERDPLFVHRTPATSIP